jgi:hypothetical protein
MIRLVVLLIVLAPLVAAGAATASSRAVIDPRNDPKGSHYPGSDFYWGPESCWTPVGTTSCGDMVYTENQGGLMDIAKASHGHARGGLIVHRVAMHRAWRNALLGRGAQISIYVTTDADAAFERRIDVGLKRGKPTFVVRNARGGIVGRGAATRPNTKTVQVAFARRLLGQGVRHYTWFAFAGVVCRRAYNACGDRSPGASLVTHHFG